MLAAHKGSQIPPKILRDVRDIVRCSHALHGTVWFDAITIDTRTFDCRRKDGIHGDISQRIATR
jgi:hypothetical protein